MKRDQSDQTMSSISWNETAIASSIWICLDATLQRWVYDQMIITITSMGTCMIGHFMVYWLKNSNGVKINE